MPNYTQPKLNNFRQNVQPTGEFAAPDLIAGVFPACFGPYGLLARVRNVGEASVPSGVMVAFYAGDPGAGGKLIGTGTTGKVLYSAEAVDVFLAVDAMLWPDVVSGKTALYVRVDDDGTGMAPAHTWHECRTENNLSGAGSGFCAGGPQ